jgi:ADP-dependent NAD(P)H-hydrate dehydratase / NAD(P)H-hydrate epimerase
MQSNAQTDKNTVMQNAIALYSPKQIYDLEKNWFSKNDSFALMQQAAWQLAHIIKHNRLCPFDKPIAPIVVS